MLGMHGTYAANMVMAHADLMIAVGARFDDRVTGKLSEFAKNCKIIHIDIDPTSIRKNVHVDVPIVGDVKRVLTQLNAELAKGTRDWRGELAEWYGQIAEWQRGHPLRYQQEADGAILPQFAIDEIYKATEAHDPVVSTGVGQHQMWAAQYYRARNPRNWLTSGGLGTMGFGFPAALGAQAAFPGPAGHRHRRGRQLPDDHAGPRHLRPVQPAGEDLHHQQPVSGDGPPVAGACSTAASTRRWTWRSSRTS